MPDPALVWAAICGRGRDDTPSLTPHVATPNTSPPKPPDKYSTTPLSSFPLFRKDFLLRDWGASVCSFERELPSSRRSVKSVHRQAWESWAFKCLPSDSSMTPSEQCKTPRGLKKGGYSDRAKMPHRLNQTGLGLAFSQSPGFLGLAGMEAPDSWEKQPCVLYLLWRSRLSCTNQTTDEG